MQIVTTTKIYLITKLKHIQMMNSENCDDFKLLYIGNCLIFGSRDKLFKKDLFSVEEVLRRIRKRLKYGINYIFNTKSFSWKEKNCKQKKILNFRAPFSSCLMGAIGEERMEGNVQ